MSRTTRFLPVFAALLLVGCVGSNHGDGDGDATDVDAGDDSGSASMCQPVQDEVTAAIREVPRTCSQDEDCVIVERAGQCECEGAFAASGDVDRIETALDDLEDSGCDHPFQCLGEQSCEYEKLSTDGELLAVCRDDRCEPLLVMTCEDYNAAAEGGIVSAQTCETNDDCYLRDDLNPCRCKEAVSTNFPSLTAGVIFDLMEVNTPRCNPVCDGCTIPNTAVCRERDGKRVCVAE